MTTLDFYLRDFRDAVDNLDRDLTTLPVAGADGHDVADWRHRSKELRAVVQAVLDRRQADRDRAAFCALVALHAKDGMSLAELATACSSTPDAVEGALGLAFECRTVNHVRVVRKVGS